MELDVHSAALEVFEKYKQLPDEAKKEVESLIREDQNVAQDHEESYKKRIKLVEFLKNNGVEFPKDWKFNRDELYDRI